ncbi:hypothetical protein [Oceanospirillum maris]|uniref:hypothetical protein n=1 Tax=Oceanospirillum maris TaxID=64977 RepID=UPI00040170D9|nr:hypothetical protein [Oceanospirillum maris]
MSTEQLLTYQWLLAGAFLAFIVSICTLFFQALFHEKRIAISWLVVIFFISILNGSGAVSLGIMVGANPDADHPIITGITSIGDYLVLALGLVEVGLFLLFIVRHYRKMYVSLPAIVLLICIGFGYKAYQDLVASGTVQFAPPEQIENNKEGGADLAE